MKITYATAWTLLQYRDTIQATRIKIKHPAENLLME